MSKLKIDVWQTKKKLYITLKVGKVFFKNLKYNHF